MLTDGEFDAVPIFEVVVQQTKPSVSDNWWKSWIQFVSMQLCDYRDSVFVVVIVLPLLVGRFSKYDQMEDK